MLSFEPATPFGSRHLAGLFGTAPMRAVFSERNALQCMLDVEVALAWRPADIGHFGRYATLLKKQRAPYKTTPPRPAGL